MHNAAFEALRLNWVYAPLTVPDTLIGPAVKGLHALGFKGANVTVPYKEAVIPLMDHLTDDARAIGAVNTILVGENGRLYGSNTDWMGFTADLEDKGFDPRGVKALILGAGGSARAVAYALGKLGARVSVYSRRKEKAGDLVRDMCALFPACGAVDDPSELSDIDLLVNTTPVGMAPLADLSPWPVDAPLPSCRLVYDLIYDPRKTRLMRTAEEAGVPAVSGIGMLLRQATFSFETWTRRPAPVNVMSMALQAAKSIE
jgi:shikimate dehydrogenase